MALGRSENIKRRICGKVETNHLDFRVIHQLRTENRELKEELESLKDNSESADHIREGMVV